MRPFIIGNASEQEMKELWSVNYQEALIPNINENTRKALVWTEEEDLLILRFYFNQKERLPEMSALLQVKTP
jgi:hypothetical protein